jgi:hypothetical protein
VSVRFRSSPETSRFHTGTATGTKTARQKNEWPRFQAGLGRFFGRNSKVTWEYAQNQCRINKIGLRSTHTSIKRVARTAGFVVRVFSAP